ncbi:MAG: murein biosynthesis integral membrane protein MurJ [Myxococcales bacterium]|nr:murein biosynthesis integral membrane protein MurJ [Myxococcales bacterium]
MIRTIARENTPVPLSCRPTGGPGRWSEVTASATTMRRLGTAALLMTSAVFLSRVIGYLRERFVAASFGATGTTDAFYAAFTVPDWLNYLVAGGTLSITLLPVYARHLAEGDEAGANRVLSAVTTFVLVVVGAGVLLGEFFSFALVDAFFHRMDPAAREQCAHLTRILLPAQLCFVAGAIATATLLARGRFAAAALAPLVYNGGIILGGVLLGDWLGIESLAWGALAGAFLGPFLVPAIDAYRQGARVRPWLSLSHPGFREWLALTLPLMIGVSLITADDWVIRYFAGAADGEITRLSYAKRLVGVAIAVAGQAVGLASMPFFARLFAEGKRVELADTVLRATRGAAVLAILAGAWLAALAEPLCDILYRGGRFLASDVKPTAVYVAIFAAAVPLWAVQGLLARAFYAARDTWTPMLAGTAVTVLALPVYAVAYGELGARGLAIASGLGILLHVVVLALLVPRRLPELRPGARAWLRGVLAAAIAATVAGFAAWLVARWATRLAPPGYLRSALQAAAGSLAFGTLVILVARPLGIGEARILIDKILSRLRAS